MLENIKSKYFLKLIFSFVDEEQKLKLVKYNKSLQNIIDLSIINYKHFTGKYIIYESKIKGKEYYIHDDKLVFDGEFLNGERNGKGYVYNGNDFAISECEYLNGRRNGKGKEYFLGTDVIFEGEYLNGKRNGKGTEYYFRHKLKFEGEYLNNKE